MEAIEYDPNRSVFIALLKYEDGEKRYILAPAALKVGDVVESGTNADIEKTVGNAMPLDILPGRPGDSQRGNGARARAASSAGRPAAWRG